MTPDVDCTWDAPPPAAIVHRARPRVTRPRTHFIYRAPKPEPWAIDCLEDVPTTVELITGPAPRYSEPIVVPEAPKTFEEGAQPSGDEPEEGRSDVLFESTRQISSVTSVGFAPPVPEPGTWALFATGLGLVAWRWRRT